MELAITIFVVALTSIVTYISLNPMEPKAPDDEHFYNPWSELLRELVERHICPMPEFQALTDRPTNLPDILSLSSFRIGDRCKRVEIDGTGLRVIASELKSFHVLPESVEIITVREDMGLLTRYLYPSTIGVTALFLAFTHRERLYAIHVTGDIVFTQGMDVDLGFEVYQRYETVNI